MAGRNLTLDLFGSPQDIQQAITAEATRQGLDPNLAVAVAHTESGFRNVPGDNGEAHGYFQLHQGAARDSGVDPSMRLDPQENIRGGVGYLKRALRLANGNVQTALETHYNGGGDPQYYAKVMDAYSQRSPQAPRAGNAGRNLTQTLFGEDAAPGAQPARPVIPTTPDDILADYQRRFMTLPPDEGQRLLQRLQASAADHPDDPALQLRAQLANQAWAGRTPSAGAAATPGDQVPPITPGIARVQMDITKPGVQQGPVLSEGELPPETPGITRLQMAIEKPGAVSPPAPGPASLHPATAALLPTIPGYDISFTDTPEALRAQDEALARQYGYDPALVMDSRFYTPGSLTKTAEGLGEEEGTGGNLLRRAGYGLLGIQGKASQLLSTGLQAVGINSAADTALTDLKVKLVEAARQRTAARSPTGLGFAAEAGGQMLFPVPKVAALQNYRSIQAAIRGGIGALTQPAVDVSPDPAQRTASFAKETGLQAAAGTAGGVVLDTGARLIGKGARALVAQSRGQKALDVAEELNATRRADYKMEAADILASNDAKMAEHAAKVTEAGEKAAQGSVDDLALYEQRMARYQEAQEARRLIAQRRFEQKQGATDAANLKASLEHQAEIAGIEAENKATQAAYTANIAAHQSAIGGAKGVPGQYAGDDVNAAYAALRGQAGTALVDMEPALEATSGILEAVGTHATLPQTSPLTRIAEKIRSLGNTATVEDLVPLLRDAGQLTKAGDGQTRYMARGLFAGLHDAIEQSAAQLPETDTARQLLLNATQAARRGFAVDDLADVVRLAVGRSSTGEHQTLNIAQVLRNIERRFEGSSPRDRLFTRSFSPEERASILSDFQQYAGLRPIPAQAPTLRTIPGAPTPQGGPPPGPITLRQLPQSIAEPPIPRTPTDVPTPTLRTLTDPPELARANLPPLQISKLVREAFYGAGAASVAGYGYQGAGYGALILPTADVLAQGFAHALLNPTARKAILGVIGADGMIDTRLYGMLTEQFRQAQ